MPLSWCSSWIDWFAESRVGIAACVGAACACEKATLFQWDKWEVWSASHTLQNEHFPLINQQPRDIDPHSGGGQSGYKANPSSRCHCCKQTNTHTNAHSLTHARTHATALFTISISIIRCSFRCVGSNWRGLFFDRVISPLILSFIKHDPTGWLAEDVGVTRWRARPPPQPGLPTRAGALQVRSESRETQQHQINCTVEIRTPQLNDCAFQ